MKYYWRNFSQVDPSHLARSNASHLSLRLTTLEIEVISTCYVMRFSKLHHPLSLSTSPPLCWMRTNFSNQYFKLFFLFLSSSSSYIHWQPLILSIAIDMYNIWDFFLVLNRGTKNHNLIDNMNKKLEQTHKKISDVKRKCTETAKTCLQMHVENVS